MDDPVVSPPKARPTPVRPPSGPNPDKTRPRSSRGSQHHRRREKHRREEKKTREEGDDPRTTRQDRRRSSSSDDGDGRDHEEVPSRGNDKKKKKKERKIKKKGGGGGGGGGGDKRKHGKKSSHREPSSSSGDAEKSPSAKHGNYGNPRPPKTPKNKGREGVPGDVPVTVLRFLRQQQGIQDQASSRKKASMRERMLHQQHQAMAAARHQRKGEAGKYPDDDDDDDDGREGRAVVARNPNSNGDGDMPNPQAVVDVVPADHPTSSVVQKFRTCSLCHRTLPRSQFSERDRYSINLNLAPGPACRTCSMTVCAVRLKNMPGAATLLMEYADRGARRGMGGATVAGYLEGGDGGTADGDALVVRRDSAAGVGAVAGTQLALYGTALGSADDGRGNNVMGMNPPPEDVNSAFSGRPYGRGDADRPADVADCKYVDAMLRMPCYLNLAAFGLFASSADASASVAALEAVRLYGTLGDRASFAPRDCDGAPAGGGRPRQRIDDRGGDAGGRGSFPDDEDVGPGSVVCLVLGEGPVPRTAVLAAQHYGWTAVSIDPSLSEEWDGLHDDVPGFTGYGGSASDFMDDAGEMLTETVIEFRRQSVRHLVVVVATRSGGADPVRLRGNAHIDEIRSRYEDVPTTLVGMGPVRRATLAPDGRRAGMRGSRLERDVGYEPNCSYIDEGVFSECRMVEVWNFHNAEEDEDDGSDGEYEEEGEEGGSYYNKDSVGSDYVKKKNRGREERHVPSEEQIQRASSKKKKEHKDPALSGGEQKNSKSEWFEERVAQFKKKQDKKYRKEKQEYEHEQEEEDEIERGSFSTSFSTLSTKETIERKESKESNPFVRMPSGGIDNCENENQDNNDHHPQEEEEVAAQGEKNKNAAAWSPPDEEVANQVWEKALAKHDEQETLCNQFEEYYGNEDGKDDNQTGDNANHDDEAGAMMNSQDDLPPGWEAIHDPASGDYYYNNWETGEVTWDRPPIKGGHLTENEHPDDRVANQDNNESPTTRSPSEKKDGAGVDNYNDGSYARDDDDHSTDTSPSFDSKTAATAATDNDSESPPPAQHIKTSKHNNSPFSQNDIGSESESNYGPDDQSSASSGIGAMQRWNRNRPATTKAGPSDPPLALTRKSNSTDASGEEDEMIVWSDEEDMAEEDEDRRPTFVRSGSVSSSSTKKQPWHRMDSEEAGGNNDSSLFK